MVLFIALSLSCIYFLEADEDLFGPSKQENTFEEDSPFGKKGGLFSGGGSSLFDDEEVRLYTMNLFTLFLPLGRLKWIDRCVMEREEIEIFSQI